MLRIVAENIDLDLGNLRSITLKYNPGIFEFENFEGSYIIPFTLPFVSPNNKVFKFQNKIGSVYRETATVEAQIWHSGILMLQGSLKATRFNNSNIYCNFYVDNGEFISRLKETKLPENDYGGEKPFQLKIGWNHDTDDYTIYPVKNPHYLKNTYLENYEGDIGIYQNYFSSQELIIGSFPPVNVTPFPFLFKVLNYIFVNNGFQYFDEYFTQPEFKKINIFNTNNAMRDYYVVEDGKKYLRKTISTINIANHLPDIGTIEFLSSLQKFFNIVFYVQNKTVKLIDRLQMINQISYDDLETKLEGNFEKTLTGISINSFSVNFYRDQHDESLKELYNVEDDPNTYETTTDPELITDPAPNQTVLFKIGNFAYYYKFINYRDTTPGLQDNWLWWPHHYFHSLSRIHQNFCAQSGIFFKDRDFKIEHNIGSLPEFFMDEFDVGVPGYANFLPKTKMQGNSGEHSTKTSFGLILMYYNGLKQDVEGEYLPHGSYKNGSLSITAYWSYYHRWQEFIAWYKEVVKEEYEMNIKLSASEIKNFDFSRKKLIHKNLFFVKSMEVQLTRSDILPARCTLIKAS